MTSKDACVILNKTPNLKLKSYIDILLVSSDMARQGI